MSRKVQRAAAFQFGRRLGLLYVSVDIDSAPHDWLRDICARPRARQSLPARAVDVGARDSRPEPSEQVIYHVRRAGDSLARVQLGPRGRKKRASSAQK